VRQVQLTFVCLVVKLPDNVWQVIKDHYQTTDDLRKIVEEKSEIYLFDGGAFLSVGNEIDLFVIPEKRGRWRMRTEITKYLNSMGERYGKIVARINECNSPSLRLARHFGFNEVSRENGVIRLEK
jgi:RimJ/RimL family protein N-acetyltransferase